MAHQLIRLTEKLYNTPHLISPHSFDNVLEYLEKRNNGELAIRQDEIFSRPEMQFVEETNVAVIPVTGSLTYEETMFGAMCGLSSYQGIVSQMKEAVKLGAKTVVLDVDSGGGEAYGAFETAKDLRRIADDNDIVMLAYVDGVSASAAYALSVAADMVVANPMAEVGSIGVLVRLMSMSKEEKERTSYIFAGDNKIPFNAEGEFTTTFLDGIQHKVNVLYENFVEHVVDMKGVDEQVVRDTQASTFMADEALNIGLVDAVLTREEFFTFLAKIVNKEF